ncbi:FAD-dependent oxidoreductase [Glutamicibacter sp. TV12E]|uniref:FAD-dependent oxidoreductase n=1 Tax=Glutamicibacter sp. TV12E TaxID=3446362 RepID=UPI0040336A03
MIDDVAIIGAGPVGLCLAVLLALRGKSVRVFEQRSAPSSHSRAIGLHPPAQGILELAGVGRTAQEQGVPIMRGIGISRGLLVGSMDFGVVGGSYPQILSLPQVATEGLLRDRLAQLAPEALSASCTFERVLDASHSHVEFIAGGTTHSARWLVGADGVHSTVRTQLQVPFTGKAHKDHYSMGDFPDATDLQHTAALFLHSCGIVESFPLPSGVRRWVVRTGSGSNPRTAQQLAVEVARRTGFTVDPEDCSMFSEFGTASRFVSSMVHGRVVLLGDAAHQISPIGGQGLCLGFADAQRFSEVVAGVRQVEGFSAMQLRAARAAARRAQLNMLLGRPVPSFMLPVRDAVFQLASSAPRIHDAAARSFTMS